MNLSNEKNTLIIFDDELINSENDYANRMHKANRCEILKAMGLEISTGYYEAKLSEKTTITNEAIRQFEEDVRNGKNVDINDYLTDNYQDYSNQTTKAGYAFSSAIEDFMSKGINEVVNIFKMLFT